MSREYVASGLGLYLKSCRVVPYLHTLVGLLAALVIIENAGFLAGVGIFYALVENRGSDNRDRAQSSDSAGLYSALLP